MVSVVYLVLVLFVKPYKRRDLDNLAIGSQFCLVCVLMGGIVIKLFDEIDELGPGYAQRVLGLSSATHVVPVMLVLNFSVLIIIVVSTSIQSTNGLGYGALQLSGDYHGSIDLSLSKGIEYHLFLSHCWSSAQDQVCGVRSNLRR